MAQNESTQADPATWVGSIPLSGRKMQSAVLGEFYSDLEIQSAQRLLELISPSASVRDQLCDRLHQELATSGDPDYFSELPLIFVLAPLFGFHVDWKDSDSFKGFVERLAHAWGATDFSFPLDLVAEDGESLAIPELMHWACGRLESYGLLLWHWDTEQDNYCGAISAVESWPEILDLCDVLEVEAMPGDMVSDEEFDD